MSGNIGTSLLANNKKFQNILSGWINFSAAEKADICREYELTIEEIEILRQLWLGIDFKKFRHPRTIVDDTLEDIIWKIAERENAPIEKTFVRRLYEQFTKIAAILIVPILLYTTYIQFFKDDTSVAHTEISQIITVKSQAGTITKLTLPDGSKICLNAGSSISYQNRFEGCCREVSLTGEAYFDVTKNKKMPMIVSAGHVKLKVYGTSFNVNAFSQEEFVKVTLVEGSVSLSSPNKKFKDENEFFINPGNTVTYFGGSNELVIQNDNTYYYTAWKDGLLVFKNSSFATVLTELSRKFNVDIELKDQTLASVRMDATFKDENINEILRLLSLSTPFKYNYGSSVKSSDGTFAKSKIYITKNKS